MHPVVALLTGDDGDGRVGDYLRVERGGINHVHIRSQMETFLRDKAAERAAVFVLSHMRDEQKRREL